MLFINKKPIWVDIMNLSWSQEIATVIAFFTKFYHVLDFHENVWEN